MSYREIGNVRFSLTAFEQVPPRLLGDWSRVDSRRNSSATKWGLVAKVWFAD